MINHPKSLDRILKNQDFFVKYADLFKKIRSLGISFDAESLVSLVTNKQALIVLNRLLERGFPLNSKNIKIIANSNVVAFIARNESLSLESISVLSMLNEASVEMDDVTMNLAKNNTKFRELMSLVYDTNSTILTRLKEKEDGDKYNESLKYTPTYLKECFLAIKTFCTESPPANDQLITSISQANKKYCDTILSKTRTFTGFFVTRILKLLIFSILIAICLPVLIPETDKLRFFKTASENKLKESEIQLSESISTTKDAPKKN